MSVAEYLMLGVGIGENPDQPGQPGTERGETGEADEQEEFAAARDSTVFAPGPEEHNRTESIGVGGVTGEDLTFGQSESAYTSPRGGHGGHSAHTRSRNLSLDDYGARVQFGVDDSRDRQISAPAQMGGHSGQASMTQEEAMNMLYNRQESMTFGDQHRHIRRESQFSSGGSDSERNHISELLNKLEESDKTNEIQANVIDQLQEWIASTGKPAMEKVAIMEQQLEENEAQIQEYNMTNQKQQYHIQELKAEKAQLEKTNQELRETVEDYGTHEEREEAVQAAKGDVDFLENELRRERERLKELREKYTEQSSAMGKMGGMVSALNHEQRNLTSEKNKLQQQLTALKKKSERQKDEMKVKLKRAENENDNLNGQIADLEQQIHNLDRQNNSMMEQLMMAGTTPVEQEPTDTSAAVFAIDEGGGTSTPGGGSLKSKFRRDPSFTELTLAAEVGALDRRRKGSISGLSDAGLDMAGHRRSDSNMSARGGRRGRRGKSTHQLEKLLKDVSDLKKLGDGGGMEDSKFISSKIVADITKSLKTFVQEDLVETIKEVLPLAGRPGLSARPSVEEFELDKLKQSPRTRMMEGVKEAVKEAMTKETGNVGDSVKTFEKLCKDLDLNMLSSLSQTNSKLVDSIAASQDWFNAFKEHVNTVISDHMEVLKTTVNKHGGQPSDVQFDPRQLEDLIKKSTAELLQKTGGGSTSDQPVDKLVAKLHTLETKNKELEEALTQAGRDKLMAMSRLNHELEALREHIRVLQLHGSKRRRSITSVRSPTSSVANWTWD